MFKSLKTIEDHNLYTSFGLVDGLAEDELMEVNGGGCFVRVEVGCIHISTGNGKNDSGNSGGSSGSGSSSSSSSAS